MTLRKLLIRGKTKALRSKITFLEALAKSVKLSEFEKVVLKTKDQRRLLEEVSRYSQISEEELVLKVSKLTKIPVAQHVVAVDLNMLDQDLTIKIFREQGAIPIAGEGIVSGIICCNPDLVNELMIRLGSRPVYIATWLQIARALDESEKRFLSHQSVEGKNDLDEVALEVLNRIIIEACGYTQSYAEIMLDREEITYQFVTNKGRLAKGQIHHCLKKSLLEILTGASEGKLDCGFSSSLEKGQSLEVDLVQPGTHFRLEWGLPVIPEALEEESSSFPEKQAISSIEKDARDATESKKTCLLSIPNSKMKPDDSCCSHGDHILIVEDNNTFSSVLKRFFSRHGIRTVQVNDAKEAIRLLREKKEKPGVVISDVHMPRMNGFEFLKILKESEELSSIPIIMLTSDQDIETELKVLSQGAEAFIAKSKDPRILCAHVERLLKKRDLIFGGKKAA